MASVPQKTATLYAEGRGKSHIVTKGDDGVYRASHGQRMFQWSHHYVTDAPTQPMCEVCLKKGMTAQKTASVSPSQIKAACWSKGFFELMADVFGTRGNDPVHGACRLVMEALKIIFPEGEKMATILDRGDSPQVVEYFKTHLPLVQHYVLKVGNQYLDGNGAHTAYDVTTDEELGAFKEIPNLLVPATPELIEWNRGIACPYGAAQKAADYIRGFVA